MVVQRLDELDKDGGDQVHGVDDGKSPQQPVGRVVAVAVLVQHGYGQRVADEPDETEKADQEHVDDDLEDREGVHRRRFSCAVRHRHVGE